MVAHSGGWCNGGWCSHEAATMLAYHLLQLPCMSLQEPADTLSNRPAVPTCAAQLWMSFGCGFPSILLFGLSTITAFSATVKGWLLVWGWLFCGSWLFGTLAGLLQDTSSKALASAHQANLVMAVIGSAIGSVCLTTYAYYHWPTLYLWALLAGLGAMWAAHHFLADEPEDAAAAAKGAGATTGADGADAAANGPVAAGASLARAISTPDVGTQQVLEQQQAGQQAAPEPAGGMMAAPCIGEAAEQPIPSAPLMTMEEAAIAAGLMKAR